MTGPRDWGSVGETWETHSGCLKRQAAQQSKIQNCAEMAGINRLTILVPMVPLTNFGHTSPVPELLRLLSGIFQTLFHLDPIVRPD